MKHSHSLLMKGLGLTFLGIGFVSPSSFADMKITFIDAGQADAALVQIDQDSGEPFTIVVDGGDHENDLEDNLPLMMTGDSTVELVVLSHPHDDHTDGLDWLISESGFDVQRVWWTGDTHDINAFEDFVDAIEDKHVVATRPEEAFYHFIGAPDFTLRVFNNGQEFSGTDGDSINNDSLVFQIIYEPANEVRVTALFTGDIEEAQGEMLVNQFGDQLKSDIVKVPHHGSGDLFKDFPATIAADFAFVSSTGTHGTFKHPRKAALDLYEATGEIFCTCDAARTTLHLTATVDETGHITVSPVQPPYFVWEEIGGSLQRVTVTP